MKKLKFAVVLLLILTGLSCKEADNEKFTKLEGYAFGTSFNIVYKDNDNYSKEIDSLFHLVNRSLSTYIPNSDISKINKGDSTIIVDAYFTEVFQKASKIYIETEGVFDPTIGVLVNAWGFGPNKTKINPDTAKISELLKLVGFNKVELKNGKIKKERDSIYFDFNAIAKGYAVDIAGRFLESKSIEDYLVEIGGEIRTRGQKNDSTFWKAGIENPNFDGTRSIQKVIKLKNESLATSGSYRKFKTDSITGKKYVHIIDPRTGYPAQSNLLSVSIIGDLDCADVDGYATALMAMPFIKAKHFLEARKELKGFLIYSDENENLQTFTTENF